MKTKEEIKLEVVNYLTKTSKHTFIKPKTTYSYSTDSYEYDYNNFTYFKIIKIDDEFMVLEDNKLRKIDYNYYLNYYDGNAKNVIKNTLFLNKFMKSIKNNNRVKEELNKLTIFVKK